MRDRAAPHARAHTHLHPDLPLMLRTGCCSQVRTMHALDHENILKFFAWYETQNHLWLVLEYCVGGDLLTILRQVSPH